MKNIAIYVGTYGKYNSGSLAGAWLNVNDYESEAEFYEACREGCRKPDINPKCL